MMKRGMQFYHRYNEDGSCKVICMDCYATLGTGWDRDAVARMEAAHLCDEWKRPAEVRSGTSGPSPQAKVYTETVMSKPQPVASLFELALGRLHPALLLPAMILLLYALPTALEILARRHVNTWLAVIVPGDLAGCAVLMMMERLQKTAILLYAVLTSVECWEHVLHVLRGVSLAWQADLIPTLVVISVVLVRTRRTRVTARRAFT